MNESCSDDRFVLPTHRFGSPAKMAPFHGLFFFTVPYVKLIPTRPVSQNQLLEFDENSKNEAHAMFRTYKTKGFRASGAESTAVQRAFFALKVSGNATSVSTVPRLRTPKSTNASLPTVALCSRSIWHKNPTKKPEFFSSAPRRPRHPLALLVLGLRNPRAKKSYGQRNPWSRSGRATVVPRAASLANEPGQSSRLERADCVEVQVEPAI